MIKPNKLTNWKANTFQFVFFVAEDGPCQGENASHQHKEHGEEPHHEHRLLGVLAIVGHEKSEGCHHHNMDEGIEADIEQAALFR